MFIRNPDMQIFELLDKVGVANTPVMKAIHHDCGPYLSAVKNWSMNSMWRGLSSYSMHPDLSKIVSKAERSNDISLILNQDPSIFLCRTPVERRPRDTDVWFHQLMDSYLKTKSGISYRSNSVFATGDVNIARTYDTPHMIFPRGNFHFCYNTNVGDMWQNVISDVSDAKDRMEKTGIDNNAFIKMMWACQIPKADKILEAAYTGTLKSIEKNIQKYTETQEQT